MFPDFSKLADTGKELTEQFSRIIALLEEIERNTRIKEMVQLPPHDITRGIHAE
jgi:hypothetical protein